MLFLSHWVETNETIHFMRHQDLCIYHTHCGGIQTKPTSSCQEKDHIFTREHSALSYKGVHWWLLSAFPAVFSHLLTLSVPALNSNHIALHQAPGFWLLIVSDTTAAQVEAQPALRAGSLTNHQTSQDHSKGGSAEATTKVTASSWSRY